MYIQVQVILDIAVDMLQGTSKNECDRELLIPLGIGKNQPKPREHEKVKSLLRDLNTMNIKFRAQNSFKMANYLGPELFTNYN